MRKLSPNQERRSDPLFRALADPSRRRILQRLARGEASVSDLAAPLDLSLGSVSRHVAHLEDAGVVVREKRGRTTYCRLDPVPLRRAAGWLVALEAEWAGRLDRLGDLLDPAP